MKLDTWYSVNPCALNFDILNSVGETKVIGTLRAGDSFQLLAEWKAFDGGKNAIEGYSAIASSKGKTLKGFIHIDTINFNKNCVEEKPTKPQQKKTPAKSEGSAKQSFIAGLITSLWLAILSFFSFLMWIFGVAVKALKLLAEVVLDGIVWIANQAIKRPFFFLLFLLLLVYLLSRIYANLGKAK